MFSSTCSSAASTDQLHIPYWDTFCQNNLVYTLNALKQMRCPTEILAFYPPICPSSILFDVPSPCHSSQMSFCFQASVLVLLFLRIKVNSGSVTFLRNPQ